MVKYERFIYEPDAPLSDNCVKIIKMSDCRAKGKTHRKQVEEEECIYCKDFDVKYERKPVTTKGKLIMGTFGAFAIAVTAATVPFIAPGLRRICLPFIPATPAQMENIMTMLKGRCGSLLDIGSGDGRIVLEAARQGFRSHGVELNRWLVLYSKYKAWKVGQRHQATFFRKDLWKTNLGAYDNIVIVGVEEMMTKLEVKLTAELKTGGRVIACRCPFPNWEPVCTLGTGTDAVWFYKHPSEVDSSEVNTETQSSEEIT